MKTRFSSETTSAFRKNSKKLIQKGLFSFEELDVIVKEISENPFNPLKSTKLLDPKLGDRRWRRERIRIFYDIDSPKRNVILLDCKLRDEKTYH